MIERKTTVWKDLGEKSIYTVSKFTSFHTNYKKEKVPLQQREVAGDQFSITNNESNQHYVRVM